MFWSIQSLSPFSQGLGPRTRRKEWLHNGKKKCFRRNYESWRDLIKEKDLSSRVDNYTISVIGIISKIYSIAELNFNPDSSLLMFLCFTNRSWVGTCGTRRGRPPCLPWHEARGVTVPRWSQTTSRLTGSDVRHWLKCVRDRKSVDTNKIVRPDTSRWTVALDVRLTDTCPHPRPPTERLQKLNVSLEETMESRPTVHRRVWVWVTGVESSPPQLTVRERHFRKKKETGPLKRVKILPQNLTK